MSLSGDVRLMRRGLATAIAAVIAGMTGLLTASPASALTPGVELVNVSTKLRADVMGASKADGTGVFLWPNNASRSQEFTLEPMGGEWFRIRARHSGKCLMIQRGLSRTGNGTPLAQYSCIGGGYEREQWRFQDMNGDCEANALCVDAGRRVIINRGTGRCIDAGNPSGRRPPQRAILQQWTCITSPKRWNADNQIWIIYDPRTRKAITQLR